MNLCRTVGRTEARFSGVVAVADCVRCEEAYGSRPQPPHVFGRHRPQTSRRETGRRRPSRRRPRCCGRGEAAGNCVSDARAFSTALANRESHVLGTRAATTPEFILRPSSAGRIEQDYKTRRQCRVEHSRGRATSPLPTVASSSRISPSEQPEPDAREDCEDLRCRLPRGDCEELEGDFLLRFSPPHSGFRSSTSPYSHTHRK